MISFDDALKTVTDHAKALGVETVDLRCALNRILARDIRSDIDMPPFDKSAMDGYACRKKDLADDLTVVETVHAGRAPGKKVGKNECAKIMTGAIVPEGADCVIQVEHVVERSANVIRFAGAGAPDNICRKGEDIKTGDLLLAKGARILPQHTGILATAGCAKVEVWRRPVVAIVATGDELVEPDQNPGLSKIRNSNGHQLYAHVESVGAIPKYHGIARDTEDALSQALGKATAGSNVLLLSGGVSMGELDLVPSILKKNGFNLLFEKVAMKPGMPTVFGVSDNACCFGLPGNPVSTFVVFELLVKPFLFKLMGHDFRPPVVSMRLERPVFRKKADRDAWLPVTRTPGGGVAPAEYHGSAHLNALLKTDALIRVPTGVTEIREGQFVDVRQI